MPGLSRWCEDEGSYTGRDVFILFYAVAAVAVIVILLAASSSWVVQ